MADALEIDLDGFALAYEQGVTLIDVRNPDEYAEMHLPGAVLIPLGELGDRLDEVPQDTSLYVICAGGVRSLRAAQALVSAGYDAVSVAGGTNGWASSGRPVVSGSEPA